MTTKNLPSFQIYGRNFQFNVIREMIEDNNFSMSLIDVLDKNYFTSLSLQFLCSEINEYVLEYKKSPSIEILILKIKELDSSALKENLVIDIATIKKLKRNDSKFIKDKALDFCRRQNMKTALAKSIEILQNNQKESLDKIRQVIVDASIAGLVCNIGIDYKKELDYVLNHVQRMTVPTGWKPIDDVLGGGMGVGELTIIMAPAGIGKSFLLGSVAAHNIQRKENVLYYTLENSDSIVGVRITANICDKYISDIEKGLNKEEVKSIIHDKVNGRLIIKQYSSVTATMNTFYSHIQLLETKKFKPTLIIFDYADLICGYRSSGSGAEAYFLGKNLYQDLRRMAGELRVPILSATQTKITAYNDDIITMDKAAESSGKGHEADIMISFSRNERDKQAGTGRFYIAKSRTSIDAITFPAIVNFSKATITALPPNENNMEMLNSMYDNTHTKELRVKMSRILKKSVRKIYS